jgi:molecular chaperone HtpG
MDEFVFKTMMEYDGKNFMNVSDEKMDLDSEEEKEELKKNNEKNSKLFDEMKSYLKENVSSVRFTHKLKNHPVCLTSKGEVSTEMEKVLNSMPNNMNNVKAETILEINENHPISKKLEELYKEKNKEELEKYTKILYQEARLIEGLPIENPTELTNLVCELISK